MTPSTIERQLTRVRAIERADTRAILHMVDQVWRVHIRLSPLELSAKIQAMPGFLAEDTVGLRGFIMVELQPPHAALIMAAGLRDTWNVKAYLDLLLPRIERVAAAEDLEALVHIGNGAWLTGGLLLKGFETREWIISYERNGLEPPPAAPAAVGVRLAHYNDLGPIMLLDTLAFNHLWRKSMGNIQEALANADFFVVAELNGQIVGYAWCEIYRQHAHLTRLAVHPHHQGLGIGAHLLRKAIVDTQERGVNLITLNTQETNHRSRALYERFGFVYTRQRLPVLFKALK